MEHYELDDLTDSQQLEEWEKIQKATFSYSTQQSIQVPFYVWMGYLNAIWQYNNFTWHTITTELIKILKSVLPLKSLQVTVWRKWSPVLNLHIPTTLKSRVKHLLNESYNKLLYDELNVMDNHGDYIIQLWWD